ncbi:MAG: hypothetical protein ACXV5U_06260 [Ilumatobacteraceae bacterium]
MEEHTLQATLASRPPTGGVVLDDGQLGQLAYHIRWSAALAAEGHVNNAAQHAILADALLDALGGEQLKAASEALDLPAIVAEPVSQVAAVHRAAAIELGFQFVSHFTSDGRHDLADLYLEATRRIGSTVAT